VFEDTLPAAQQQLCLKLSAVDIVRSFYLAGGTAAALHLGHRESVDLDFFRNGEFEPDRVGLPLAAAASCRWDHYERNTVVGAADGVKVSFFHYPYPLIEPTLSFRGLAVASAVDVACMKLVAIGQRGLRRDFIDLRCLLEALHTDVWTLWQQTQRKFGLRDDSLYWLARGLAYFEDAEAEAEPTLRRPQRWAEVRVFFQRESKALLDRLRSARPT
jgi:predicted nucleotidyltransferase component of viral defense system